MARLNESQEQEIGAGIGMKSDSIRRNDSLNSVALYRIALKGIDHRKPRIIRLEMPRLLTQSNRYTYIKDLSKSGSSSH